MYRERSTRPSVFSTLAACAVVGLGVLATSPLAGCSPAAVPSTAASETAAFPLHVAADRRHLLDAHGRPFLLKGDAPWCLFSQLTLQDAEFYLTERRRQGFNAILVELADPSLCMHAPGNVYGDQPFLSPGDFRRPNERYFRHVDAVIGLAGRLGFVVLMTPAYMGYGGGSEGWYARMTELGPEAMAEFGRYVARRLASHRNIVWVQGGDFSPPDLELARAVAEGIRDVDPGSLQTFHGARLSSALGLVGWNESWLSLNNIYTDDRSVIVQALEEYERSTMPFILIEGIYEDEHGADARTIRGQAYEALLSGATGHVMGHRTIWRFLDQWRQDVRSPGARSLAQLHALFESLPWWELVPSVEDGWITGASHETPRIAAALTRDRSIAIAYLAKGGTARVDLSALAQARIRARWFDPVHGDFIGITDDPLPNAGTHTLVPPTQNSGGDADWVLVLDAYPNGEMTQ
jgi:hypothetical protein